MRIWLLAVATLAGVVAVRPDRRRRGSRIVRISRIVADLARSEAFYTAGLGFSRVAGPEEVEEAGLLGLGTARQVRLRLGAQEVALVECDPQGPAYPADSRSNDLWFQHLAIVVSDMAAAMQVLAAQHPAAISTNGAQVLPPRNGGVVAFKFRDPDGHPLELLHFPPGQGRPIWQHGAAGPFLGIDHSALSIRTVRRSLRFYRGLGFRVGNRSFNHGPAQARMDGLPHATAHITGLRLPGSGGPGLELLRYVPPGRPRPPVRLTARLTDWVTIEAPDLGHSELIADPDGHLMLLQGVR